MAAVIFQPFSFFSIMLRIELSGVRLQIWKLRRVKLGFECKSNENNALET